MRQLRTHFITDSAVVAQGAALGAMDALLVLAEVDELVEGLAAGVAGEGRGARVGAGVAGQELALQEGAAAHGAGEAPLGLVQPQVPLELVLHRELLGAVRAREVADAVDVRPEVPLLDRERRGVHWHGLPYLSVPSPLTFASTSQLHLCFWPQLLFLQSKCIIPSIPANDGGF